MLAPAPPPADAAFNSAFRSAMARFATGVTIVTAQASDGRLLGLTVNSFNSVSLAPPLVLWSLANSYHALDAFVQAPHYAINVLSAQQKDLALRFAHTSADRWNGVAYEAGLSGAPLLAGAIAHFECANRSHYPEGDHLIFVGRVERCQHRNEARPLLYHGSRFYTEHPL